MALAINSESQAPLAANQTLRRVGHCLHRSENSRIYYAILKRTGKQITRSLKTSDKGLAKRQFSELQEEASRLNREDGSKISFEDPFQFPHIANRFPYGTTIWRATLAIPADQPSSRADALSLWLKRSTASRIPCSNACGRGGQPGT